MKIVSIIMGVVVLLLVCVGVSYQVGKNAGFATGSEWALVQADIVAQEAGVFMPVYLKDGKFRVVLRQPPGVYRRAWETADQYEEEREAGPPAKLQQEGGEHKAKKDI